MRRRRLAHMEEDSLQADVMRFMVIVAFCLIAILAMVRNSPTVKAPVTVVEDAAIEHLENIPPTEPVRELALEQFAEKKGQPAVTEQPEQKEQPVPREPQPQPQPQPQHQPQTEPQPIPSYDAEGLSLRFASEADFMRLISKGRITLYAYAGEFFLTTSDTYRFHPTNAPRQLYEIDRQTIPAHVLDAAGAQTDQNLQWGVGLSPRIEKQISGYVEQNVSGQLHIDRYEQVLHVEAG